MSIIDRVFLQPTLRQAPAVLVDVGASGGAHAKWKKLARHSIGVGFEPDRREVAALAPAQQKFRRWIFSDRLVVADESAAETKVYLTRSPFCSSTLQPNLTSLEEWSFAELFAVVDTRLCATSTLGAVLRENHLENLDWLKCDTQGTDLRIFRSLPEPIRRRVLVVEFEPGIIDAYEQEDKFSEILTAMESEPYWLAQLEVQGVPRGAPEMLQRRLGRRWARQYQRLGPTGPGWVNAVYLRRFTRYDDLGKREYLVGWTFAILLGQLGYALEIAELGKEKFQDPFFDTLCDSAVHRMRWGLIATCRRWPRMIWRKLTSG